MIKTSDILETIRAIESINYFDKKEDDHVNNNIDDEADDDITIVNDEATIKGIEEDIKILDPNADERLFKQREKARIKRIKYNERAYIKRIYKL